MIDVVYGLTLGQNGVVIGAGRSNCLQPGDVEVDEATYISAHGRVGLCTYASGALTDYAPPPTPAIAPYGPDGAVVSGNQFFFALGDLNLASVWITGVKNSKPKDQNRVGLISRDTMLSATDPLLLRIATNAGKDADGNLLIVIPTVFAKAASEPL